MRFTVAFYQPEDQYLPPLAVGVCAETRNQDALIIPAIRHLACLLLLSRFHAHTTSTISLLKGHIDEFGHLSKVITFKMQRDTHLTCLGYSRGSRAISSPRRTLILMAKDALPHASR